MLTLLEALNKSIDFLKKKEVPNARLDTELLFAHVLNCNRLQLYLDFEKTLEASVLTTIKELIVRRGKREPLQHIIGYTSFFDLKLKVNPNVLVPRPETEELIEFISQRLKQSPQKIIDLGTGSGAIALSLAKKYPYAEVFAADKSPKALELAKENAQLNNLQNRVQFIESDWLSNIPKNLQFDLIVSNPPYLTKNEYETAQPEVKDFEPKMALFSEDAGMRDLLKIMKDSLSYLKPNAYLALETGIDQHSKLCEEAKALGYSNVESLKDLNKLDRFIIACKPLM